VFLRKRHLVVGLACCALLHVSSIRTRRILPLASETPVRTEGAFQPDGHYPGEPFAGASGVRSWGSWSGGDQNVGRFVLGPFTAPRVLRFGVGGYPDSPGNSLRLELAGTPHCIDIPVAAVGERWHVVDFPVPEKWQGRPVQLVAEDAAKQLGGWLAVTERIRGGRSDGVNALLQSLASWAINGLLLGILYCAGWTLIAERRWLAPHWQPLAAGAAVATAGYVAFWMYFFHAAAGFVYSCALLAAGLWQARRTALTTPATSDVAESRTNVRLALAVGAFYLALLHLFPAQHDFYTLAANRYREALPGDNVLSHTLAERLFAAEPLKNPIDEWLSSDRPPLQSGWQLITWPVSKALGLERRTASGTAALWFQLLWIPAAYGLLRSFRMERARAAGWVAVMALAGFFVQNTTYTWPKLSSAAFAGGAFGVLLLPGAGNTTRSNAAWAAGFAALAWLSHGGVAFSFLALIPFLVWRFAHSDHRDWRLGAVVLAALVLPWLAYQTFYDPPANRLFKWHLAGQTERDARGTWETIRSAYERLSWEEVWENRRSNFHAQVFGDWRQLFDGSPAQAADRRNLEFFHTGRALTWWPLVAVVAIVLTRRRWLDPPAELLQLAAWLVLTLVLWCLLMFGRYQAVIHHGSYAVMIGLFVWFSVVMERAGRG
jgi:hypothetical protein